MATVYKTAYDLSEFDIANIDMLAAHTGQNRTWAVHQALSFCRLSLQQRAMGRHTSVLYSRGTTRTIDHGAVAEAFNRRSPKAVAYKVGMYRTTEALEAIEYIKNKTGAKSDSIAVAYALSYAAACVRRLQGANNGKKARIFFTASNNPNKSGSVLIKHPYDITFGNKCRRAVDGLTSGMRLLAPWRKKVNLPFTVEIAAAEPASPPPQTPPEAVEKNAAPAANAPRENIRTDLAEPVQALKQLKLRKSDNGFRL